MSMGKHSQKYGEEIVNNATYAEFGIGSIKKGFSDPRNPGELQAWLQGKDPKTGEPLLREQKNAPTYVYDRVLSVHWSVDTVYKAFGPEDKQAIRDCIMQAATVSQQFMSKQAGVGVGAGGKVVRPCQLIDLLALEESNRKGECGLHVHAMNLRAGLMADGKTGSLRNAQVLYRKDADAQTIFNAALVHELRTKAGIDAHFDPATKRCVVPGVDRETALKTMTRRTDAIAWCKANGWDDPNPYQIAVGINATRPPKQAFDQAKAHAQWTQEAERDTPGLGEKARIKPEQKKDPWLQKWVYENYFAPVMVLSDAIKAGFRRHKAPAQHIEVTNPDAFLYDAQKRPRWACHDAAVRAVRSGTFDGLDDALAAAKHAYKSHRRPRLDLPKSTVVTIDKDVVLTDDQARRLTALAHKKGWELRGVAGVQTKEQRAEQQQDCGYRRTM